MNHFGLKREFSVFKRELNLMACYEENSKKTKQNKTNYEFWSQPEMNFTSTVLFTNSVTLELSSLSVFSYGKWDSYTVRIVGRIMLQVMRVLGSKKRHCICYVNVVAGSGVVCAPFRSFDSDIWLSGRW